MVDYSYLLLGILVIRKIVTYYCKVYPYLEKK